VWLKNLPLKLTALGLALLLWFHVATNRDYDFAVDVNLRPGPLPDGFALTHPLPEQVKLLLSGSGKELIRLLWDEGYAEFSLEPRLSGPVPVTSKRLILRVGADVRIKQVLEPAQIEVQVDTVISSSARVRFEGRYALDAGVSMVRAPQIEPHSVTMTGPRELVQGLASVSVESLDIGPLKAPADYRVGLELRSLFNVTAAPESVLVRFAVAGSIRREVKDVPVSVPAGWRVDPATVTLSVSGARARLDSLPVEAYRAAASTAQLRDADSTIAVEATAPPFVEILAVAPDRISVRRP
jgi:hypothetical protein